MRLQPLLTQLRSFAVLGAALLLAACAGAPKQIASYPSAPDLPAPTPIAREPYPSDPTIVYNADLDLAVNDVDAVAEQAIHLANDAGGYLERSQSWRQDGRTYTTLVLAVPPARFDDLRRGLLDLGTRLDEVVSREFSPDDYARAGRYAHISMRLQPASTSFVSALPNGWSPARTFERAFSVIASIFQVFADIMIWIVVVAGPFLLIAFVIWIVVRQVRHTPTNH